MRALAIAVRVLLQSGVLLAALCPTGYADDIAPVKVSPSLVGVGVSFGGADVLVEGTAPPGTELVVKVSAQPEAVRLSKKGQILGIFWMTVERAQVENVPPSFFAVYASRPLESLLNKEDRSRLGLDMICTGAMGHVTVTSDSPEHAVLPPDQAEVYVAGLRDVYIKDGRYMPCTACHRPASRTGADSPWDRPGLQTVDLKQGAWSLHVTLPADAPLGAYGVTAYYVKAGQVVGSQTASFSVAKTGLVQSLGALAADNAPLYGAVSLLAVTAVGLIVGTIFPKSGH